MRRMAVYTVAVLCACAVTTVVAAEERESLVVRVYRGTGVPPHPVNAALPHATRVLASAGVDVRWRVCHSDREMRNLEADPCADPLAGGELVMHVTSARLGVTQPRTLGQAIIRKDTGTGTLATAFMDRVAAVARESHVGSPALLGAVIAHEVGHLLGGEAHSIHGLMSAHWSRVAMRTALDRPWQFSSGESARIRQSIRELALSSTHNRRQP